MFFLFFKSDDFTGTYVFLKVLIRVSLAKEMVVVVMVVVAAVHHGSKLRY